MPAATERFRASVIQIHTPEGVMFSLPLAGPVSRLLALTVDGAVTVAAVMAIGTAGSSLAPLLGDFLNASLVLLYFLVMTGYGVALEWFWNGRTLGKRVVGLRVADSRGLRLTFSQVLIRNLLRAVDSLPLFYLVGGTVCVLNSRLQRLGDLAAGTIVVRTRELKLPALPPDPIGRQNSMRPYRALSARLRQKVSPEMARIALDALRRRDDLEPAARLRLFAEIAGSFRNLVEFPEEATLYLTDEQYVWNVAEIVFGNARKG
jgi:uncharacterized RDD family membrane protein YckC